MQILTCLADRAFDFPSTSFYRHLEVEEKDKGVRLTAVIRVLFNIIAYELSPYQSMDIMQAQVASLCRRGLHDFDEDEGSKLPLRSKRT